MGHNTDWQYPMPSSRSELGVGLVGELCRYFSAELQLLLSEHESQQWGWPVLDKVIAPVIIHVGKPGGSIGMS